MGLKLITLRSRVAGSRGTWVAHLVKHPTSAWVIISWFVSSSLISGSAWTVQSLPGILSLPLSAPPPLALSPSPTFSLSLKINNLKNKKKSYMLHQLNWTQLPLLFLFLTHILNLNSITIWPSQKSGTTLYSFLSFIIPFLVSYGILTPKHL